MQETKKETYETPQLEKQEPLPDITAMPIGNISVTLEDVPDPRVDIIF